ncbi:MAG: hypothetical protein IPN11_10770 [Opitutaceae bacterium]|nr:hypothetical protein [Opitutaceae bacterium]
MQPPLLPATVLARLLRLARLDGTVVLAIAGAFALASALGGNRLEVLVGVLIAGAGALELHGAGLLRAGEVRGISWLVASQLYLLVAVLAYVGLRLISFDPALINLIMTETLRQRYIDAGLTHAQIDQVVQLSYYLTYAIVGVLTVVYQGGLAIYYYRRRDAVEQALSEE